MSGEHDLHPAVLRERMKSVSEKVQKTEGRLDSHGERLGDLEQQVGSIMASCASTEKAVEEMKKTLDHVVARYWDEHPSKVQQPPVVLAQSPVEPQPQVMWKRPEVQTAGIATGIASLIFGVLQIALEVWRSQMSQVIPPRLPPTPPAQVQPH